MMFVWNLVRREVKKEIADSNEGRGQAIIDLMELKEEQLIKKIIALEVALASMSKQIKKLSEKGDCPWDL